MQKIPGLDTKIIRGSQKFVYKKIINLAFAKRAGYFRNISFADLVSLFPSLRPLLRDNEQREIKYNNKTWSLKHGRYSSILIAWKKKHWRIVSNKQKSEMLLDHWQSIISVSTPTYFIYQLFIIYSVNYLSSCTFETFFFC